MNTLAIFGGRPVRTQAFASRPYIDDLERRYVAHCLDSLAFSRFIGSPVGGFQETLRLPSSEAARLDEFWSVLGGQYVRLFESEFAKKHRVKYAVSMNSATSGLTAACLACGVGPGDEVVTSPFTFTATATAIHVTGAKVVFADIAPDTYCITPESVARVVTPKTKAVVPVHILGNAGHVAELAEYCRKHGLAMIEDAAQGLQSTRLGRVLGTFGQAGAFSFQETKNMMTGEGGMVVTDSEDIALKLRLIRNHGEAMVFEDDPEDLRRAAVGHNFRLPEISAAIGYAQIQKLEKMNGVRAENTGRLRGNLKSFSFIVPQAVTNDPNGFFPYCAGFSYDPEKLGVQRDLFAQALRAEGIPVATGFPRLLNENPLTRSDVDATPEAKRLNYESYLGFFQVGLPNTTRDMDQVAEAVGKIAAGAEALRKAAPTLPGAREFNSGRR